MVFNYYTEVIFVIDIFISFFRSYCNYELKIITNNCKIITNYLRNNFILDLIEAIPSYTITRKICNIKKIDKYFLSDRQIIFSILLTMKSFKIFKVLNNKNNRIIEILYEKISNNYYSEKLMNIIIYLILIFSFFHSLICIHIFLGEQSYPNWMVLIHIINENILTKYISSFYYIITTITTVGYGDITCISSRERIFQIILLAIGTIMYSFIITKFGNYIGKQSNIEIKLDHKKNILEQIRITHPLMPFKLYYKMHNYLIKEAYKLENNKNMEMRMLVNSLPDKIRNELLKIIYKDVIKNFKIFKDNKNSDFILKMLACFVQTTCKKDTILMLEGKIVDNIIFVKDGRLILEANIDLLDPLKSIKKYFKENFKDLDNKNLIFYEEDDKEKGENENNISILKKRLNSFIKNTNKGKNENNSIFQTTNIINNNESLQIGLEDNFLEDEEKSIIQKEETNCQYLKILDIRKNEYFGEIYMFLERPSPLTLKVKSKIAEIYLLKKKDAININNIHHNIMNRIKMKSFKNLINIRKKTFKIITKFYDNKFCNSKGKTLQDMSWFTEKSKLITDRSNFTNPSTLIKKKENNISLFAKKRKYFKNSCIASRVTRAITKINSNNLKKCISTNSSRNENEKTNFNNLRNSSKLQNITNDYTSNNQKTSTIINSISNTNLPLKSPILQNVSFENNNISNETNKENSNFYKSKNNSSNNINECEITKKENEIITLNNFNSKINKNIIKKINSGVKKEKIINLWKFKNEIINFKMDNQKAHSFTCADENDINIINNTDKYDLNTILFNRLLEYLESEKESESESKESTRYNYKNFKEENAISFNINASYYNLNKMTKGKIIKNEKFKKNFKKIIKSYIKDFKKDLIINTNKTSKVINKYNKIPKLSLNNINDRNYLSQNNLSKEIGNIESISSISRNTIEQSSDKNSKKNNNAENNSLGKEKKLNNQIISKTIKQKLNHNSDKYINFKKNFIDSKNAKSNINHKFPKLDFSAKISKNKIKKMNSSIPSIYLIKKYEDIKIVNLGSSRSSKKRKKK